MSQKPANYEYIEVRDGAYFVTGSRVGLDVVVQEFKNGRTAEAIFDAYPSVGSLAKVYGAIAFCLDHPSEVDAYLDDQSRRYEELKLSHPMPQDMIDRFKRLKGHLYQRPA